MQDMLYSLVHVLILIPVITVLSDRCFLCKNAFNCSRCVALQYHHHLPVRTPLGMLGGEIDVTVSHALLLPTQKINSNCLCYAHLPPTCSFMRVICEAVSEVAVSGGGSVSSQCYVRTNCSEVHDTQ